MGTAVPDEPTRLEETRAVLGGMLEHLEGVVGSDAAYAMFHYAAALEGERMADADGRDLDRLLDGVDQILGTESRVLEDSGDEVRIRVEPGPFAFDSESARGFITGLLNGVLSRSRRRGYGGSPEGRADPDDGALTLAYSGGDV